MISLCRARAVQGMCGIMNLTGETQGEPQKIAVAWIDIMAGL